MKLKFVHNVGNNFTYPRSVLAHGSKAVPSRFTLGMSLSVARAVDTAVSEFIAADMHGALSTNAHLRAGERMRKPR